MLETTLTVCGGYCSISEPDDFVLATEEKHSVRDFVELAFNYIGIKISWSGEGLNEIGSDEARKRISIY